MTSKAIFTAAAGRKMLRRIRALEDDVADLEAALNILTEVNEAPAEG